METALRSAMGRSIEDVVADYKSGSQSIREAMWNWAEARTKVILPPSDEATLTAQLLGGISYCFPSVESFDDNARRLHQWLSDLKGRRNMMHFSELMEKSSSLYHSSLDFDDEGIIAEEFYELLSNAAEGFVERCTFKIDAFTGEYAVSVAIHDGQLLLDIQPEGKDIISITSIPIDDTEEEDDEDERSGWTSGSNIPTDIVGHVEVLEILNDRRKVMLRISVQNASGRTYGPLDVFEKEAVDDILEYRGVKNTFTCLVAQPLDTAQNPSVIECTNHAWSRPR